MQQLMISSYYVPVVTLLSYWLQDGWKGPDCKKDLRLLREAVHQCLEVGLIAVVDPVHNWANGPGYTHPDDLQNFEPYGGKSP